MNEPTTQVLQAPTSEQDADNDPVCTWNHRVIEFESVDGNIRAIYEVHYENGVPVLHTENPATLLWDADSGKPEWVLQAMMDCLKLPVLTEQDFQEPSGNGW